jgi:hypothetical protein
MALAKQTTEVKPLSLGEWPANDTASFQNFSEACVLDQDSQTSLREGELPSSVTLTAVDASQNMQNTNFAFNKIDGTFIVTPDRSSLTVKIQRETSTLRSQEQDDGDGNQPTSVPESLHPAKQ